MLVLFFCDRDDQFIFTQVWPDGRTAFPDFFKDSTKIWWTKWIDYTYNNLGLKFDALWIEYEHFVEFVSYVPQCDKRHFAA